HSQVCARAPCRCRSELARWNSRRCRGLSRACRRDRELLPPGRSERRQSRRSVHEYFHPARRSFWESEGERGAELRRVSPASRMSVAYHLLCGERIADGEKTSHPIRAPYAKQRA